MARFHKQEGKYIPIKGSLQKELDELGDGIWDVDFKKMKKPKSMEQLGYLFAGIIPFLANEMGYIQEGMPKHDIAIICQSLYEAIKNRHKQVFGYHYERDMLTKKRRRINHSLKDADSEIARKFIDRILNDEMFMNYNIPAPEDKRAVEFWNEQIEKFGNLKY